MIFQSGGLGQEKNDAIAKYTRLIMGMSRSGKNVVFSA